MIILDDANPTQNLEDHRLPIFSEIIVCTSGINNITRRTEISKLVTTHGGTYLTKLERPVKVTHLLCSGDEETDKIRYAEKFNGRREANIQLVWEEWFWDSLHYGGRFEEETYQVRRPRPEPKPVLASMYKIRLFCYFLILIPCSCYTAATFIIRPCFPERPAFFVSRASPIRTSTPNCKRQ